MQAEIIWNMRSLRSRQGQIANAIRSSRSGNHHQCSQRAQIRPASSTTPSSSSRIIRPLVPPPDARSGPLLTRRPDRALPEIENSRTWLKTLPIFIALVTISSLAIFNYQKTTSSTVNSILYALRTNKDVRDILGDEIYFASKIPWIKGELSPLQGNIDISFWVRGTKGVAETKFVSIRRKHERYFQTLEWSLKSSDGRILQLLDSEGTKDPMQSVILPETS